MRVLCYIEAQILAAARADGDGGGSSRSSSSAGQRSWLQQKEERERESERPTSPRGHRDRKRESPIDERHGNSEREGRGGERRGEEGRREGGREAEERDRTRQERAAEGKEPISTRSQGSRSGSMASVRVTRGALHRRCREVGVASSTGDVVGPRFLHQSHGSREPPTSASKAVALGDDSQETSGTRADPEVPPSDRQASSAVRSGPSGPHPRTFHLQRRTILECAGYGRQGKARPGGAGRGEGRKEGEREGEGAGGSWDGHKRPIQRRPRGASTRPSPRVMMPLATVCLPFALLAVCLYERSIHPFIHSPARPVAVVATGGGGSTRKSAASKRLAARGMPALRSLMFGRSRARLLALQAPSANDMGRDHAPASSELPTTGK
ncbi:hypothetical protein AXG93_154s1380 [Marchantia polymorpha subsp. ruderalis]|uniref:Uncharacterized protein n=1 Tax=Marchantia polymorpha subsp. ruderalis TaxID=1480154 RepID=A0A176VIC6_MARPO|nr:hypothetical protein AXG93_154s1380 [Marchantia polymorpha subsp. ruderalis]